MAAHMGMLMLATMIKVTLMCFWPKQTSKYVCGERSPHIQEQ